MRILGYIISERKVERLGRSIIQVDDITQADLSKPTLLVGWKKAKGLPSYKSILDNKLEGNLYWSFSITESHTDYERGISEFKKLVYDNVLNNVKYYYVNPITIRYGKIKKLLSIVKNDEPRTIYISNGMAYIPYKDNSILGVSLRMLKYCGISEGKVINILSNGGRNKLVDDNVSYVKGIARSLGSKKYAMPYFV